MSDRSTLTNISDTELQESYWFVTHYKKIQKLLVILYAGICGLLLLFSIWKTLTLYVFESRQQTEFKQTLTQSVTSKVIIPPLSSISIETIGFRPSAEGFENGFALLSNANDHWYLRADLVFLRGTAEMRSVPIILKPAEKRYFVGLGIPVGQPPLTASLRNERWHFLSHDERALLDQLKNITVDDIAFLPSDKSGVSRLTAVSKLRFTAHNESLYGFWEVRFPVIAKDNGSVAAVGEVVVNSIDIGEKKQAETTWFIPLLSADEFDIRPLVDIVDMNTRKQGNR